MNNYYAVDSYTVQRNFYEKLFLLFIENKDLSYNEFVRKISSGLGKKVSISILNSYIEEIRLGYSVRYSEIMDDILKLTIARRISDKKSVKMLEEKLDNSDLNLNKKINLNAKGKKVSKYSKNDINKVINENNETEAFKDQEFKRQMKKNISEIDVNSYVDFLTKQYNLEATSILELTQFSETLKYFIDNINKNIELLNSYDPDTNAEEILNFHVSGEEKLSSTYKDSIRRLLNWKLEHLESLLTKYQRIYDNITKLLKTKDIDTLEAISKIDNGKTQITEDFIYEHFKQLASIKKVYKNNISNLNNLNDERKNSIVEEFNKKLIFRNN